MKLNSEQIDKLNSIKSGDKKTEFLQEIVNQNVKGTSTQATVDAGKKLTGLKMGWNPLKTEANPKYKQKVLIDLRLNKN